MRPSRVMLSLTLMVTVGSVTSSSAGCVTAMRSTSSRYAFSVPESRILNTPRWVVPLTVSEQFTVNGTTHRGVFKILDSGTLNAYLDDVERMAVTHPALLLVTEPTVTINVNDSITRDGRIYTVFK